ncbi:MAG: NADH:ubiquinone reductase (Na(+)-transporting) subunit C [Bacteroidales bacterium]
MKDSNTYIFLYASAMVVIVAAVLSAVATLLKPYQDLNVEMAKKLDILRSVEKAEMLAEADNKTSYINDEYEKYIVDSYVIDHNGEIQEGIDAFEVNVREENRKPVEQRNLPIFVARDNDGSENFIIPVYGRGLWGPVFGYIALEDDYNTIFGVIFDHEGETPGLGAEISTPVFENQFKGKKIFDEAGEFVSVDVVKPGAVSLNEHRVDGISGGTITGNGVDAMLEDTLGSYVSYFRKQKNGNHE